MTWLGAAWAGAQKVPRWVWFTILGILGVWAIRRDAYEDGRRHERRIAERNARKAVEQIEKESRDDLEKANRARDRAPEYDDADGVPDKLGRRIFRD